jgi:hypothetical protein
LEENPYPPGREYTSDHTTTHLSTTAPLADSCFPYDTLTADVDNSIDCYPSCLPIESLYVPLSPLCDSFSSTTTHTIAQNAYPYTPTLWLARSLALLPVCHSSPHQYHYALCPTCLGKSFGAPPRPETSRLFGCGASARYSSRF